jgi:hypothetical protein
LLHKLTTPSSTFTAGTWYHVVVTKSSTSGRKFYVNGSVVATDSGNSNSGSSSGGRNLLGAYSSSGNPTSTAFEFDGKLDQIRIYDSAISAADVTTLYREVECEPAAINALNQFNTVLYTGDGSNGHSINTVGFKPDFTWIKTRTDIGGSNHFLFDSIRGATNRIFSNRNLAEAADLDSLVSFDTDGITVTDDAAGNYAVNGNNETYVAWNWKAPLANLSTSFNGSNSTITIANNAVFNFTTPTSLSVWVNRNTTSRDFIIDKGNGSSGSYGWQFEYYNSEYVFQLNNTVGGIMDIRATTTSGTGIWDHVAVTYDSNQVGKIYLNGVLKATDTMSGTASFNTNGCNNREI